MDRLRGDGGWQAPNLAGRRGPVIVRDAVPAQPNVALRLVAQTFGLGANIGSNESVGSTVRKPD